MEPVAATAQPQTPKPEPNELLLAQSLHKSHQMGAEDLRVLRGVNLEIRRGEWVAIVGASGSGKSTLLHLLGALDRPDRGRVWFDGEDVFALRGRQLDRYRNLHVGFVFQFYHLLPELNTLENVLIAAMTGTSALRWPSHRPPVRQHAIELLERVGLSQRLRHRPPKLSGGERQRVAIARALMNKPDVLLADEPTGNLDARTGQQILEVLSQLHREGQNIVMVTHDSRVADYSDRQLLLENGKLTHFERR